jgi:hypothetical protein
MNPTLSSARSAAASLCWPVRGVAARCNPPPNSVGSVVQRYAAYAGVIPSAQHRAISKLARKTNHVERFNCTLRQRVSRLVRATLSFSKKLSNHIGAIKYLICHYNLTKCTALPG